MQIFCYTVGDLHFGAISASKIKQPPCSRTYSFTSQMCGSSSHCGHSRSCPISITAHAWDLQCNGKSAGITCAWKLLAFTTKNSLTGADIFCGRSAGDMHSCKVSVILHVLGSSMQWKICRDCVCIGTACFHCQELPHRCRSLLWKDLQGACIHAKFL